MMFICINNLLNSAQLSTLREGLTSVSFEEGGKTAGWHAREVKNNYQASPSVAVRQMQRHIRQALADNALFNSVAYPADMMPVVFSRTGAGEGYGRHVDDAVMRAEGLLRSDLSVTVFLSGPDEYQGGELVIENASGEEGIKLEAGSAVVYPSTTLHRVEDVTSGQRLVALTWVESLIRDDAAREILFDLDQARRSIFADEGKSPRFDLVSKSHANSMRRWAKR